MSDPRRFGRRRRGMHFKPSGSGPKPGKHQEREAQQARAEAVSDKASSTPEPVYERSRYQKEIERAENVAAGLPPEGAPQPQTGDTETERRAKGDFREPHL